MHQPFAISFLYSMKRTALSRMKSINPKEDGDNDRRYDDNLVEEMTASREGQTTFSSWRDSLIYLITLHKGLIHGKIEKQAGQEGLEPQHLVLETSFYQLELLAYLLPNRNVLFDLARGAGCLRRTGSTCSAPALRCGDSSRSCSSSVCTRCTAAQSFQQDLSYL